MRHELNNRGGVNRLPTGGQVDQGLVNAALLSVLANLSPSNQPQKEHHYHGKSVGLLGGFLMLVGAGSLAFVSYSVFSGESLSRSVERVERSVSIRADGFNAGAMTQRVGAWFKSDSQELTMKDQRGKPLKAGDKLISSTRGGVLKEITILSIEKYGNKLVMTLSDDHPEDKRPRVLFGQEQINQHHYNKVGAH